MLRFVVHQKNVNMSYTVSLLKTAAECDSLLLQVTREKRDLDVKKVVLANTLVNLSEDGESLATELALANGDVTTYTSVLATLTPDGKAWKEYDDKLATAVYRLRVLNKRAGKKGGEAQVDHELDVADLDAMVANRTAVIDAVTAHKATL